MGKEEWLELESDPGLFTLLVEDLGVTGVQVDEIYELSKVPSDPVFGFIFLFRWQHNEKKHNSKRSSRGGATSLNVSQASSGSADLSVNFTNHLSGDLIPSTVAVCQGFNNSSIPVSTGSECQISKPETGLGDRGEIFFAHQVVPNSCATHSLLSILMNTSHQAVDLGPLLREFRRATRSLPPNQRGLAIGFMPPLMEAHNRHARQQPPSSQHCLPPACDEAASVRVVQCAVDAAQRAVLAEGENGGGGVSGGEGGEAAAGDEAGAVSCGVGEGVCVGMEAGDTFHFVCFLPVGRFLYELDGLKQEPINHGPLEDPIMHVGWTRQCLDLLKQRMRDQEVRYNLMAVVPDRRLALASRLENLEKNRSILDKTIQQLTSSNATAVAIKLEHNGSLEPRGVGVNGTIKAVEEEQGETMQSPDAEMEASEVDTEKTGEGSLELLECEVEVDGRPVTRAASRAAAAAVQSKQQYNRSASLAPSVDASGRKSNLRDFHSSAPSPTSIFIDLTEGDIGTKNNNALADDLPEGVMTRRRSIAKMSSSPSSKYLTRSSTKRDTLASHSLANTRSTGMIFSRDEAFNTATSTTAFLTTEDLCQLLIGIEAQARACSAALAEEESKRQAYRVDASRRIHNYEPFIRAFLEELKEQGMLRRLVGEANASISSGGRQLRKRRTTSMTPQKAIWWSSSAVSTSSSSTNGETSGVGTAGRALSRLAVKRARLTAVASRPSTRMSSVSNTSAVSIGLTTGRAGSRRRMSRKTL